MKELELAKTDPSDPEISLSALERMAEEPIDESKPLVGEEFGKYVLVGELGVGGMAEVFLAIQHGLQGFLKVVTLKRVLPHLASPDFISMFIDEARLAARLEHPNIVKTFEFGEHEGQYYTVMEYLAGEDLGSVMNRAAISKQPVPLNMAAMILSQLCDGLHFAHELTDTAGRPLGLVHRDVNPSNVIITYGGEVKIIDFGVAKFNKSANQTQTGTIKGKLAYMSPEQILARGIDRRSDVFSLGVVLWELVAGCRLFARETDAATLYAIMNDPIPRVRRHRPNVPEELEAIISTALSRDAGGSLRDRRGHAGRDRSVPDHAAQVRRARARGACSSRCSARRAPRPSDAIAQTRALAKNVSLVMKLRSEVRHNLAKQLTARQHSGPAVETGTRTAAFAAAAVVVVLMLLGLGYLLMRSPSPAKVAETQVVQASIKLDSRPSGAAIFVRGEPTGLVTPATLTGLSPGEVEIRIELAGHTPSARTFNLKSGENATHLFELGSESGRVVLSGLPADSVILVEGQEYQAGDVISLSAGRHEVRIIVDGKTIIQQTLETGGGHQVWELRDQRLVRK